MKGIARMTFPTAASQGLLSCNSCGLLSDVRAAVPRQSCARCGTRLQSRKRDSISRTWALIIASYVLYLPANLLPILETTQLFALQRDTIMSGVVYLWVTDSEALAVIVFVASIVVPLTKLIALTLLLISVQRRWAWHPHQRTQLYRMVEFIGRWSMLDVFVVAFTIALVQLQALASVRAGPGIVAFAAVVVLTMFATKTFDPRLIWDTSTPSHE